MEEVGKREYLKRATSKRVNIQDGGIGYTA